jgi:hypothetical protein
MKFQDDMMPAVLLPDLCAGKDLRGAASHTAKGPPLETVYYQSG